MNTDLMAGKKRIIIIGSLVIILLAVFLITIQKIKNTPIKIGYVNTLTGPASTSTISMKDVVILAVEQINKNGGIKGRKIELIIKDDKFDPDVALRVDQELIDEGVSAIIGHSFSFLYYKVSPILNKHGIVMISPTAQSVELDRLDDNIFRLAISLNKEAKIMARIAKDKLKLKKMAVIYDLLNQELSENTFIYFKKEIERLGGEITSSIPFNSKEKYSAPKIARELIQSGADGVYIITDAVNAALICQHIRKNDAKINIISHGWAFNDPALITECGRTVEGVMGINFIDINFANKSFLNFEHDYYERFNSKISGPGLISYEAAQILFNVLSKTSDPKKLKNAILKQKEFNSIDGKLIFDKFGDPVRKVNIMKIENGKPNTIEIIKIEELKNIIYENNL